jgi:hypothetical protein
MPDFMVSEGNMGAGVIAVENEVEEEVEATESGVEAAYAALLDAM